MLVLAPAPLSALIGSLAEPRCFLMRLNTYANANDFEWTGGSDHCSDPCKILVNRRVICCSANISLLQSMMRSHTVPQMSTCRVLQPENVSKEHSITFSRSQVDTDRLLICWLTDSYVTRPLRKISHFPGRYRRTRYVRSRGGTNKEPCGRDYMQSCTVTDACSSSTYFLKDTLAQSVPLLGVQAVWRHALPVPKQYRIDPNDQLWRASVNRPADLFGTYLISYLGYDHLFELT